MIEMLKFWELLYAKLALLNIYREKNISISQG